MVNGEEITNLAHVSASDDASIKPVAPFISLEKTVFKGGVTYTTGEDIMTNTVNAEAAYCCKVKNNGEDTYTWGM
jgi:hypothetical protein